MAYESEKRGKPLFFYDKMKHMTKISLRNVNKIYKNTKAVQNFNLEICQGEFLVIVGPSGCGKSTLLKMIADIEHPDSGTIESEFQNISMVFQDSLLFPHMNVFENIAFGIKNQNQYSASFVCEKVESIASVLGLSSILKQKASTLSGGQSQKVSLARALVQENSLILMDEPCAHLDEVSKVKIQDECLRIHRQFHPTIVYVTHDQKEAMKMASRLVVMNDGKILQSGSCQQIYQHPYNTFVARFFGNPPMNIFMLDSDLVGVRPEDIVEDKDSSIRVKVISSEYAGREYIASIQYGEQILHMIDWKDRTGQQISVRFKNIHRSLQDNENK